MWHVVSYAALWLANARASSLLRAAGDASTRNMAAKQVMAKIRLQVLAGSAKPSPPVGPALGQHGVNIMDFCKDFNAKTAHFKDDVLVPVSIDVFNDRSFAYTTTMPPVSSLLKEVAGVKKGASNPGQEVAGKVTWKQVYSIAQLKSSDASLQHVPMEGLVKTIAGTARSMGLQVIGDPTETAIPAPES